MHKHLYHRILASFVPLLACFSVLALVACGAEDPAPASNDLEAPKGEAPASGETVGELPPPPLGDITIGSPDAPVTLIEYASMTCSHCASFHKFTFKRVIENFVDTGKVQFVYRELPLDAYALEAAAMARCFGEDRFLEVVGLLFDEQENWVLQRDPSKALRAYGRRLGMSDEQYTACQDNETLINRIGARASEGRLRYKVRGTPAIVVNGELYQGNPAYNPLAEHLNAVLAELGTGPGSE